MMVDADLLVTGLTLLGGGAVGASLGGMAAGVCKWGGGRLHLIVIGCMAAGAGLGFTYGGPVSIPGYVGAAEAEAADLGLPYGGREAAVLKVLRAYYPGDYAGAVTALRARRNGRETAAFDAAVLPVVARQAPLANTENAVLLLRLARREQQAMMGEPMVCYHAMRSRGRGAAAMVAPGRLRDDQMRLTARLLTQTALAPQARRLPADVSERVRRLAAAALADLPSAERRAISAVRGAPTAAQASAWCDLGLKLYDALLLAPDDEAAQMFKGLAAGELRRTLT